MLCYEIHKLENGCSQEIPEGAGWKYCPTCGRSTGHIQLQRLDGQLTVPENRPAIRAITLRNEGLTPVSVSLELEKPIPGVQTASRQPRYLAVNPRMPQ